MNRNKIVIYVLIVLSVLLISTGIAINASLKRPIEKIPTPTPTPTPKVTPDSTGHHPATEEDFEKWKTEKENSLKEVLIAYMKEHYREQDNWQVLLQESEETYLMGVSLNKMKEDNNFDTSMFHTEEVSCDDDQTAGLLRIYKDHLEYEVNLSCQYSLKNDNNVIEKE